MHVVARKALLGILGCVLLLTACQTAKRDEEDEISYGLFPDFGQQQTERRPAGSCFSEAERRSDALARLRTQMMVTSLTCRAWLARENIYEQYQQFTFDNGDNIRNAQRNVGAMLSRYLGGSGARLYDTYVTELANDEFILVTQVGAERYCVARSTAFDNAVESDQAGLDAYLDEALAQMAPLYPEC